MTPWILLALAAAAAAPGDLPPSAAAPGDLTARYAAPDGNAWRAMKVEVSGSGLMRVDLGDNMLAVIRRDGHTYMVAGGGSAPMVADVEDLKVAARESLAKTAPSMCEAFKQVPPDIQLVQAGTATVRGRTGDAWFKQTRDGKAATRPELVVSHDPALAPIGAAIAEELRATTGLLPDCPAFAAMWAPVEAALRSGTPLAVSGLELTEVREAPVDPKRFELPAAPASLDELRKLANGMKGIEVRAIPPS